MATVETLVLYIIFGAIIGIVWSLRKIYVLEGKIASIDTKIEQLLENTADKKQSNVKQTTNQPISKK